MTLTSPGMEMDYGHGFSISGDLVGWVVYRPGLNPPPILWRPYVHDLSTGVGRFVGGIDAYGADLSLNRLATWTQSSAVAYDVETGAILAPDLPDPIWTWKPRAAVLSGRTMVARLDQIGGGYSHNLWACDLVSNVSSLITSATTVLDHPAVSGRNVVWADKRNGTWDIYAYDLGIAVPRIDVTPGSVAFGDVMLGASSSKTVTIKNSGDATLVVRSVALETPASGVSLGSVPPSTTVAPGASIQVKLTFAPTSAGPVSTVLKVVSDDADLPVVRIPVTGAGVNRRLTLDALDQTLPELFRDTVVFSDNRNGNWDIYSYDLKTGAEKRLTSDPTTQTSPAVCGSTVVWEDWRNGNPDIYSYDLATGVEKRLTTDAGQHKTPDISDGRVVYCYYGGSQSSSWSGIWDIRLIDLLSGGTATLSGPNTRMDNGHDFAISGDRVAWVVYDNPTSAAWKTYVWDLTTATGRIVSPDDMYGTDVSADRLAAWHTGGVYAYDLAAGARIALATPPFGTPGGAGKEWMTRPLGEMQNAGALSGRTLVARYWSGAYGVNLWAADVTSGTWSLITSATTVLDHPAVSGRNVVWADKRNGTWDIYAYDLGIAVPRIDVTPGSVAFGDVMLGASSSKTVTIKNSGDATLVVRSVALETPASGVSLGSVPPSTTVAPGASIQVKLTFAPTSAGPVSTVLKVVSDDADLPVVRIPVTGAGVNRRLTLDALDQTLPELFRDTVVFSDNRNGNWDIYSYDLKTGAEKRLTSDPATQTSPAVCGSTVVWEDWRNGNPDIYSYDLATGVEKRLTTDAGQHKTPDISDGRVVYCYYGGSQSSSWSGIWDIRLIDLVSGGTATLSGPNTRMDNGHDFAISGDRVAWVVYDSPTSAAWKAYVWDLTTATGRIVSPDDMYGTDVSADRLVRLGHRRDVRL